jgi:hypothetical protein
MLRQTYRPWAARRKVAANALPVFVRALHLPA